MIRQTIARRAGVGYCAHAIVLELQEDANEQQRRGGRAANIGHALIIVGNPKGGTPLIAASPTSAIDLPLKILAWEDSEGRNWLAHNEPEYLMMRHDIPPELLKNIAGLGALAAAAAEAG